MKWTSEKPTAPGWYFYREPNRNRSGVVHVTLDMNRLVWFTGDATAEYMDDCNGEWQGPISPEE